MVRIRLVNPNSDEHATAAMAAVARDSAAGAPNAFHIEATTSTRAPALITNAGELRHATEELLKLFDEGLDPLGGVIISAFGDPGVDALRARLPVPVVGIGEAALREASTHGNFAICTTTPELAEAMRTQVEAHGLTAALTGVLTTSGVPQQLMADEAALDAALAALVATAVREHGAKAVVIGGGPLALAARRLAAKSPVPLVQAVPAAVRDMSMRVNLRQPTA
jgi:allantoin racemase